MKYTILILSLVLSLQLFAQTKIAQLSINSQSTDLYQADKQLKTFTQIKSTATHTVMVNNENFGTPSSATQVNNIELAFQGPTKDGLIKYTSKWDMDIVSSFEKMFTEGLGETIGKNLFEGFKPVFLSELEKMVEESSFLTLNDSRLFVNVELLLSADVDIEEGGFFSKDKLKSFTISGRELDRIDNALNEVGELILNIEMGRALLKKGFFTEVSQLDVVNQDATCIVEGSDRLKCTQASDANAKLTLREL